MKKAVKQILDDLNSLDALSAVVRQVPGGHLAFGPQVIDGADYVAVVIWWRRAGHPHYKTLTLGGVWACLPDRVIVGQRQLKFQADHYNPESYFHHIRRTFAIHYGPHAPPPAVDDRLMDIRYDAAQRLTYRRDLTDLMRIWWRRDL
jgi:hypothetical protein